MSKLFCLGGNTSDFCDVVNSRDKVIDLKSFEVTSIHKKVELLLDSSGAKIKHIKGSRVVESTTEAARGIWSGLHVDAPFKI